MISVSEAGNLSDLNMTLTLEHPWIGYLIITLEHVDTVTTINLLESNGCQGDNVDAVINDEASFSLQIDYQNTPTAYPENAYQPQGSLSDFDGETLAGDGTLRLSDNAGFDIGTLRQWCLAPSIEAGSDNNQPIFSDRFERLDF